MALIGDPEPKVKSQAPNPQDSRARGHPGPKRRRGGPLATQAAIYTVLGLWSLVCILPIYWTLIASIKPPIEFVDGPHYFPFVDFQPSLHAWRQIVVDRDDDTLLRFLNSLVVGLISTSVTVVVGMSAAYALVRSKVSLALGRAAVLVFGTVIAGVAIWDGAPASLVASVWALLCLPAMLSMSGRGRDARMRLSSAGLFAIIIATRILPPFLTVLPLYYLFQKAGLYDTRTALTLAYMAANLPIAIWLLRGFIIDMSPDVEEAAQLDGASRLRVFFTMVLPMCRVGIVATSAVIFLLCWNEYVISVYLAADHAMTMPPFLASQMTTREQMAAAEPDDYARLAVVVILMLAPLAALTGFCQHVLSRVSR